MEQKRGNTGDRNAHDRYEAERGVRSVTCDAEVETRVTDETVRRVRKKLRDAGSTTQIKAVWGYGYKLEAGS